MIFWQKRNKRKERERLQQTGSRYHDGNDKSGYLRANGYS